MKRKTVIWAVVAVAVMAFIFWQSTRNAHLSDGESVAVLAVLKQLFSWLGWGGLTDQGVRKCAHIFEYAVQAFVLVRLFSSWRLDRKTYVGHVLWLGLLTAVIDENIQLFSPGRGGMVQDVLLDFLGTIIGLLIPFF